MFKSFFFAFDYLGKNFVGVIVGLIDLFLFNYFSLRSVFLNKVENFLSITKVIAAQIYFTGFQALPLIFILSLSIGSLFIIQGFEHFAMFGGTKVLANFLVASLIRETSPLIVALVVIARSGTAVASELGNMKANKEIDALISLGINPYSYIVFPRLFGGVVSVVCLAFFFCVFSILGGLFVASVLKGISFQHLSDLILLAIAPEDLLIFVIKNIGCGFLIFSICAVQGLSVKRSPHEVPQRTTQAVVQSIVAVTIFNVAVTGVFYFLKFSEMRGL